MYRKKRKYLQCQIRRWRWMLPQQNQKKKENAIATALCHEPQQNRESEKQQLFCQLNGQETCHPYADGDSGFVFHLLDSHLQCQCLASLRHSFCRPASLRGSHLLHPPAVLHVCLREPHHLLLHEQAFPHGLPGHLHLLRQAKAPGNTGRGCWWRGREDYKGFPLQMFLHTHVCVCTPLSCTRGGNEWWIVWSWKVTVASAERHLVLS